MARQVRNKKNCIVCGKAFECPPSNKTVTCSKECRKEYAKLRNVGKILPDDVKKKMSEKAKGRDLSSLQPIAVEAAKHSPNSGRFETNVNAIDWHLISPEGNHYYFHSLSLWLRENCLELFGCEPDSRAYTNARAGLSNAKRAMLGKEYPCCTYKGWRVIPTDDDKKRMIINADFRNENL